VERYLQDQHLATDLLGHGKPDPDRRIVVERAIERLVDEVPPTHRLLVVLRELLAIELARDQRYDEAAAILNAVVRLHAAHADRNRSDASFAWSLLGEVYWHGGGADAAERAARQAMTIATELHGETDSRSIAMASRLGRILLERGKLDEARQHLWHAWRYARDRLGHRHGLTRWTGLRLGRCLERLGRFEDLAAIYEATYRFSRDLAGEQDPEFMIASAAQYLFRRDQRSFYIGTHRVRPLLAAAEQAGHLEARRVLSGYLAMIRLYRGDAAGAAKQGRVYLQAAETGTHRDQWAIGHAHLILALAAMIEGRHDAAATSKQACREAWAPLGAFSGHDPLLALIRDDPSRTFDSLIERYPELHADDAFPGLYNAALAGLMLHRFYADSGEPERAVFWQWIARGRSWTTYAKPLLRIDRAGAQSLITRGVVDWQSIEGRVVAVAADPTMRCDPGVVMEPGDSVLLVPGPALGDAASGVEFRVNGRRPELLREPILVTGPGRLQLVPAEPAIGLNADSPGGLVKVLAIR